VGGGEIIVQNSKFKIQNYLFFLAFFLVAFFVPRPVLAQTTAPAEAVSEVGMEAAASSDVGDVPDPESPWFGLQNAFMRVSENIQMALARTEEKRTELELSFATREQKLSERIASSSNPEKFGKLLERLQERYQKRLEKLDQRVAKLETRREEFRQRVESMRERFEEKGLSGPQILEERLEQRQDKLNDRLDERQEVGNRVQEQIRQRLEEQAQDPEESSEPEDADSNRYPRSVPPLDQRETQNVQGAQTEASAIRQIWNEVVSWFE